VIHQRDDKIASIAVYQAVVLRGHRQHPGKMGNITTRKQPKSYLCSPTSEQISYPLLDKVLSETIKPSNGDTLIMTIFCPKYSQNVVSTYLPKVLFLYVMSK
jgi:hypothetical protein